MPATTINLGEKGIIMFITDQIEENKLSVNIYKCDDKNIPQGKPFIIQLEGNEVEYHKKLRLEAKEKGHFIPGHSTNPEWNPDYIEIDENNS